MAKNQWIIEDGPSVESQQPEAPETYFQQAKRIGGSTALQALKGLESAYFFLPELFGKKSPPKPSEIIEREGKLTPEYLEPRSVGEKYLHRLAGSAPLAATGGLGALARTAVGSGVGTLLGSAGLPEPIQDIGQAVTELGLGVHSGRIPTIKAAQKAEYELAKSAVKPGSRSSAKLITNALGEIEKQLGTEVSKKYSGKIRHAIDTVGKNLIKGEINPNTAVDLRKKLYKLSSELPGDISKTYIDPLTKGINNYFATYAAENPKFYKHLSSADKLTSLKHMKSYIGDFVGQLQLNKLPGGELATNIISKITKEGERFIRGLSTNSSARKYYFDAISSLSKDDPSLFIRNILKLPDLFPSLEKESSSAPSKWVIEG